MGTAESWQMSNAPVLNMAVHLASLEIFKEAGGVGCSERKISKANGLSRINSKESS